MRRETDNDIAAQLAKENPAWHFKIGFAPTVAELLLESRQQELAAERRDLEASETYIFEDP